MIQSVQVLKKYSRKAVTGLLILFSLCGARFKHTLAVVLAKAQSSVKQIGIVAQLHRILLCKLLVISAILTLFNRIHILNRIGVDYRLAKIELAWLDSIRPHILSRHIRIINSETVLTRMDYADLVNKLVGAKARVVILDSRFVKLNSADSGTTLLATAIQNAGSETKIIILESSPEKPDDEIESSLQPWQHALFDPGGNVAGAKESVNVAYFRLAQRRNENPPQLSVPLVGFLAYLGLERQPFVLQFNGLANELVITEGSNKKFRIPAEVASITNDDNADNQSGEDARIPLLFASKQELKNHTADLKAFNAQDRSHYKGAIVIIGDPNEQFHDPATELYGFEFHAIILDSLLFSVVPHNPVIFVNWLLLVAILAISGRAKTLRWASKVAVKKIEIPITILVPLIFATTTAVVLYLYWLYYLDPAYYLIAVLVGYYYVVPQKREDAANDKKEAAVGAH